MQSTAAEEAVVTAMMSIGRLMKARVGDGLDPGSYALLHTLRCTGARRISELATAARLDTSTISRHVSGLERQGLLDRTPDPDDRRAQVVDLTPAGHRALDESLQLRLQLLTELFADWPRHDIDTFAHLLTTFAAGADARNRELDPTYLAASAAH